MKNKNNIKEEVINFCNNNNALPYTDKDEIKLYRYINKHRDEDWVNELKDKFIKNRVTCTYAINKKDIILFCKDLTSLPRKNSIWGNNPKLERMYFKSLYSYREDSQFLRELINIVYEIRLKEIGLMGFHFMEGFYSINDLKRDDLYKELCEKIKEKRKENY